VCDFPVAPGAGLATGRDLPICGVSVLFSLRVTFASGYQAVYQALILVLAGIVLYAFLNARRERLGQIPEPADNPPDDTAAPVPADTQREPAAGKGET
jgi:basic amino acid/polyamine antiporter, APA family